MKPNTHPAYQEITVTCSCGNTFKVGSTLTKDQHLDVCAQCHPFYTGKQRVADTGKQVDKFKKRYSKSTTTS